MYAYQQPAATAQRSGGLDVTAWALVALVVALVCAAAGWAIASQDVLSRDDLASEAQLAAREGAARGMTDGYSQGAKGGRSEAALRARLDLQQTKRSAAQEGYQAGLNDGRARAAARAGDPDAMFGLTTASGAYPSMDYSDVLASGLFGDEPGFSTSAYGEFGYGTGSSVPYGSSSPLASSSLAPGY